MTSQRKDTRRPTPTTLLPGVTRNVGSATEKERNNVHVPGVNMVKHSYTPYNFYTKNRFCTIVLPFS